MGCDGGTIPRRDELVRLKKKPEQVDKNMERMAKWLHCAISQEPLRQPIMACELGRLYNKESLLEYLLDKSTSDSAQHIRGLKDTKELNMTPNPAFEKNDKQKEDLYLENGTTKYICPVTGLQMNGHYKFCFLWECGCVLSEKALKEVKSDVCHKCGAAYDVDDAVMINGNIEEVDDLRSKMEDKRAKAKAAKKAKKAQKRKSEVGCTVTSPTTDDQPSTSKQIKTESEKLTNETTGSSKLTNGQPASSKPTNEQPASSKPTNEQPASSKPTNGLKSGSGKLTNGSAASLKSTNGSTSTDKRFDHTKSDVYKSLFLSKDQKDIKKAHWVTYNPYYAMH